MLKELKEITRYNEHVAEDNSFTFDYNGMEISNFFYDETLRFEVNPIEYYNSKDLKQVIQNWNLIMKP